MHHTVAVRRTMYSLSDNERKKKQKSYDDKAVSGGEAMQRQVQAVGGGASEDTPPHTTLHTWVGKRGFGISCRNEELSGRRFGQKRKKRSFERSKVLV